MNASWPWEVIATGVIGAVATTLAWWANPGQRRKDDADTRAATADAAESITNASRDIVDMTTARIAALESEVEMSRGCKEKLLLLEAEVSVLRSILETT